MKTDTLQLASVGVSLWTAAKSIAPGIPTIPKGTSKIERVIQPKLTLGAINDKYEQEADQIAVKVIKQLNSTNSGDTRIPRPTLIQENDRTAGLPVNPEFQAWVNQACTKSGESLDHLLRHQLGKIMGADFSAVQLHHDSLSDRLNRALGSTAFTIGNHIFFSQGAYQPETQAGKELLIHELTHVIQQGGTQGEDTVLPRYIQRQVAYNLGEAAVGVEITVNDKVKEDEQKKYIGKNGVIVAKGGAQRNKKWYVRLHKSDKVLRFTSLELDYAFKNGKAPKALDEATRSSDHGKGSVEWFPGYMEINHDGLFMDEISTPGRNAFYKVWLYKKDNDDEYPHVLCEDWAGWMGKVHYTSVEVVMDAHTPHKVDHLSIRRVWFMWDQDTKSFEPLPVAGGTGTHHNIDTIDSDLHMPINANSTHVRFKYKGNKIRWHKVSVTATHPAVPNLNALVNGWNID